jgi:NADH:ubiquinone oxidoreductase subunit 3 (subunit A)
MRKPMSAIAHDLVGRLVVATAAPPRSAVIIALVLLSERADAASIASRFEYHSFWRDALPIILMAVVATVATWQLRKKIRQQVASAPPEARRNPRERRQHYLSILFITAPMMYAFALDVDLVFPVLAIVATQTVVLTGLRALGLSFRWRLACILPASLLALLTGVLVPSWPDVTAAPAADRVWVLAACAISFAVGALLSYLSFPPAYRARAW